MKGILGAASIYGVAVGLLYSFGFWGSFHLNPLELATFTDLVAAAAYPIFMALAAFLAGAALSELALGERLPPGGGAGTAMGRWLRKHWQPLVVGDVLVISVVALVGPKPAKWVIAALLMSPFGVAFIHARLFVDMLPHARVRFVVLSVGWLVLSGAFPLGRFDADQIVNGRARYSVAAACTSFPGDSLAAHRLSYVGHVGTKWVLWDPSRGALIFVNDDKADPLILLPNNPSP